MKNRNVRSIADVSLMAGQPQVARLSVGAQQHRALSFGDSVSPAAMASRLDSVPADAARSIDGASGRIQPGGGGFMGEVDHQVGIKLHISVCSMVGMDVAVQGSIMLTTG